MRRITNQKDLIKNIIQECDCPFFQTGVLVPVRINGTVLPTWLYMVGDRWTGSRKEISGGVWR
jgi:hypothetical protein